MKLAEITPQLLSDAPDEEVRLAWLRLSQWFGAASKKGKSVENYVNAALWVWDEYKHRGWEIDQKKPLAQAALNFRAKKAIPGELEKNLESLPSEVVLVHNFVSLVGSAVSKESARDIDVLFRAQRDQEGRNFLLQTENVWLPVRKVLASDKSKPLHFIDNPQGPHSDNVPLYSLVLRREPLEKKIIKSLSPGDRFSPEKPLMAGYTDFFSTSELWPWCQKKLQAGARLAGEIKFDGFRCIISKKGEEVRIWFEDSQEEQDVPALVEALRRSPFTSIVLDGELLATSRDQIVPRTQLLQMLAGEPGLDPLFMAFDCLYLDGLDLSPKPLEERQKTLVSVSARLNTPYIDFSRSVQIGSEKELEIVGRWAASQPASEGLMVKDTTQPYHPGGAEDWAKLKTVVELKVTVLEIKPVDAGFTYLCGLRLHNERTENAVRDVAGQKYATLGSTFVTKLQAKPGDTLNVRIEELLVLEGGKLAWGKPTVVGPDSSRDSYLVSQAVDLARRGHVLKVETRKEDVSVWGPVGAPIAFIAAAPSELELARNEPIVGQAGEVFKRLYLEPVGLEKSQVAILYLIPRVEKATEAQIETWNSWLMKELSRINPKIIVALGKVAAEALEDIADFAMPHPAAVHKYGDSGEVARKIRQAMRKIQEVSKSEDDGADTRSSIAAREYARSWWQMVPPSGRGRFVLQAHWRGLSEEELKLSHEALLKTSHSIHCDLRFEIDNHSLWGFTVFEGSTEEIRSKGRGEARILHLSPQDSLQGAFKLRQPHEWLTIAAEKPYISAPGGVGATSKKYSKFFQLDTGEYEFSFARLHGREVFLHGEKLKGRLLMQYAPVGETTMPGGETQASTGRVWIINKPDSQTPYTATHELADVEADLEKKGQDKLVWSERPGEKPQILDINGHDKFTEKEYSAAIFKADSEKRLVYGVVSEPLTVDAQGDVLSEEEIEQFAHNYLIKSQKFDVRHNWKRVRASIVESWIAKSDFEWMGEVIKKGSWIIGVKVFDDDLWSKIRAGVYKAFSIGGRGVRVRRVRFA